VSQALFPGFSSSHAGLLLAEMPVGRPYVLNGLLDSRWRFGNIRESGRFWRHSRL